MPTRNTIVTSAAGLVAAGVLAVTGASLANATTDSPADTGITSTASASPSPDTSTGDTDANPSTGSAECGPGGRGHAHTEVTGADRTAVVEAVKAKDSGITVAQVLRDPDGSYDVLGSKADGSRVMVEVSKDLSSVQVRTGPPGGMGKGGMREGTPVDAAVLTKIAAAVKAKDSSVTVHMGVKLTDGSYRAMGTKADGTRVAVTLDKDLAVTDISTKPMGMGRHGGMRGGRFMDDDGRTSTPSPSEPAPSTQGTSTSFNGV